MNRLKIMPVGLALGFLFSISFIICVAYGMVVPTTWQMYPLWERLLPGFKWLSLGGFFLGLIETFLYGMYIAIVFVPIYNFFNSRKRGTV